MIPAPATLSDILHPLPREKFITEFLGRQPIHVPGKPDKFSGVMSWPKLNELLELDIWTQSSLKLFLDRRPVPVEAYCQAKIGRNHQHVVAPVAAKVRELIGRGASVVLDEVETLNPGLRALARILEIEMSAAVGMNLYCSFRERQAFASHYDNHDVWVCHVEGEKLWRIYENQAEFPIEHPSFKGVPQAQFDQAKGKVAYELVLKPGDLLYLPRGTFHDALAVSDSCIHLSVNVTRPIGLQWLSRLWELAVSDPLFRMDMPRTEGPQGPTALRQHVDQLRQSFARILNSDAALQQAQALHHPASTVAEYNLPSDGPATSKDAAQ